MGICGLSLFFMFFKSLETIEFSQSRHPGDRWEFIGYSQQKIGDHMTRVYLQKVVSVYVVNRHLRPSGSNPSIMLYGCT